VGTAAAFDRGVPDDVLRDYATIQGASASFSVNLENGAYSVTVVMGDELTARPQMRLRLEPGEAGEVQDTLSLAGANYSQEAYRVTVHDGRLTLELSSAGNPTDQPVINALVISREFQFDFGTSGSPVESGHIQVSGQSSYSPQSGFGWTSGSFTAVDRAEIVAGGAVSSSAIRYTGETITFTENATLRARAFLPNSNRHLQLASQSIHWSAPVEQQIVVEPPRLAITELHYHPLDPTAGELAIDRSFTASDFEFVELKNLGPGAIALDGYRLSGGIDFTFPELELAEGEVVLVVANQEAFEARYGVLHPVIGQYDGQLNNAGERIVLADGQPRVLIELEYDDSAPWPASADGEGPSLQLIDPESTPPADYSNAHRWWSAPGTPGLVDGVLEGDSDRDGDVDFDDIAPFVLAMQDPGAYASRYGVPGMLGGDLNRDGRIDVEDILELVAILAQARVE
jgi:hypothetical protein